MAFSNSASAVSELLVGRYVPLMPSEPTCLDISTVVRETLARVPAWIRQDFSAKDRSIRARAEETLAAIIADAIKS